VLLPASDCTEPHAQKLPRYLTVCRRYSSVQHYAGFSPYTYRRYVLGFTDQEVHPCASWKCSIISSQPQTKSSLWYGRRSCEMRVPVGPHTCLEHDEMRYRGDPAWFEWRRGYGDSPPPRRYRYFQRVIHLSLRALGGISIDFVTHWQVLLMVRLGRLHVSVELKPVHMAPNSPPVIGLCSRTQT